MPDKRQSKKRDAILNLIRSSNTHVTAQWVYEKLKPGFPDLSLGTVYRNIRQFREEGLVASLGVVNSEEHFDGTAAPHPHVCCRNCRSIEDLDEKVSPALFRNFHAEIPGFTVDLRNTVFYGVCSRCKSEGLRETAVIDR